MSVRATCVLCMLCWLAGCAALRPITASPGDLADYRATRVAPTWGRRLAAMQRYLERRPQGAWARELREAYATEEPRFFARASESREGARGYLADLPSGPHAQAAVWLLVAFDTKLEDFETEKMLAAARTTEMHLDEAAEGRRAADDWVATTLAVLADDAPWGRPLEASPALAAQLRGRRAATWGGVPNRVEVHFSFAVPDRAGPSVRHLDATLELDAQGDALRAASLSGPDLIVRWAELDVLRPLDAANVDDRSFAASRVRDRLAGLLERSFPETRCTSRNDGDEADLVSRACDGRRVRVLMGGGAGQVDRVDFSSSP